MTEERSTDADRPAANGCPTEVTFRGMVPCPVLEDRIRSAVEDLGRRCPDLVSCRVAVTAHRRPHRRGPLYDVQIDITAPGADLCAGRERHENHAHADPFDAIRDAFATIAREVEGFRRRRPDQDTPSKPPGTVE